MSPFQPNDEIVASKGLQLASEAYHDGEFDNGASGAAETIDWAANGNKQRSELTDNVTYTFTDPSGPASLVLKLEQDVGGTNTVTWPAAVEWEGGSPPVVSPGGGAVDIVSFYFDGTTYYGSILQDFS